MMTTACSHLSRSNAVIAVRIEAAVPALATACALTERFANMVGNGEDSARNGGCARLKTLKRQIYGRANLGFLRARLAAAA